MFSQTRFEIFLRFSIDLTCHHFILDSLSCPKDADCGVGGTCLVDPYMPDTIHCRCDKGYFKARDGKCVGTCVFTAFRRTAT